MSSVIPANINALSIEEKLQAIQNVKAETEVLRQRIAYAKNQVMDATLPQVAAHTPPLADLRLRGRNSFKGHVGKVYSMKLTSDDSFLVSAAQDGYVLVWDAYTTSKIEAIQLANSWVISCGISLDNSIIATGGLDNVCTLYPLHQRNTDTDSQQSKRRKTISPRIPLAMLKGHKGFISQIEFLNTNTLVTASADMTFSTWDLKTGDRLQEYADHLGDINALSIAPNEPNIIASASSDATVKIWDLRILPARAVQTFAAITTEINAAHFFPDGNAVGVGCDDGTCRVFDIRSDCQIAMYNDPSKDNASVSAVRFTPSGRLLLAGDQHGTCGAWDILKSTWIEQNPAHSGTVTSIQVSSDGHRLYSSSWDSTLRAWEP